LREGSPHAFSEDICLSDVGHGRKIAVDLSMWLHEFGKICASDVMVDANYTKVVEHCVHNANILRFMGISPVFVADNREVAAKGKAWTNERRTARAKAALEKAHLNPGDETLLKAALRVTLDLQNAVLDALREEGLDCFQAPLEADSQLAMLYREKKVFAVMSGDTDLIVHGVEMLIYKWNIHSDVCSVFNWRLIHPTVFPVGQSAADTAVFFQNSHISCLLAGLESLDLRMDMLQCYALCSGCDYFKVEGWGFVQAKIVLRAGIMHFYDKVGHARGPHAIATWLTSQLCQKVTNGRPKPVQSLRICGVVCKSDTIFDLVLASFLHFGAAPAFSLDQNKYVTGRYHIVGNVAGAGINHPSCNPDLQSAIGYHLSDLNKEGRVYRFTGIENPDDFRVHVNSSGVDYVQFPVALSVRGAGLDEIDVNNATGTELKEWLRFRQASYGGLVSLPVPEMRTAIAALIDNLRHSSLPEPHLPMPPGMVDMGGKSKLPVKPAYFCDRLAARAALNEKGEDPRGQPAMLDNYTWFCCSLDEKAVQALAPVLPMAALLDFFDKRFFHTNCKPLKLGAATCLGCATKPVNAKWAIKGREAWYSLTSPSSLGKRQQYDVSICFELTAPKEIGEDDVADPSTLHPSILKVSHAWCECKAGLGGRCWHVAYALFTVHNQLLSKERRSQESVTARTQRWHLPADHYIARLRTLTVAKSGKVPVRKLGSTATTTMVMDSETAAFGGRVGYGPPLSSYPTLTDPGFKDKAQALYDTLAASYGERSAAEMWVLPLPTLLKEREEHHAKKRGRAQLLDETLRKEGVLAVRSVSYRLDQEQRKKKRGEGHGEERGVDAGMGLEGGKDEEAPEYSYVLPKGRKPWFKANPDEVVPKFDVIVQDATNRFVRVCKWCGALHSKSAAKVHWNEHGHCMNWEVTPRRHGTLANQWSAHWEHKGHVAPSAGESFRTANPGTTTKK
jgi:hypothetical protein